MSYIRKGNCLRGESKHSELLYQLLIIIRLIVDDYYEHALRLFQERDTGVIRLQASVQSGEFKRKPIWTAFITHQILSFIWILRDSPKVFHLEDLQQYIFSDDYSPGTSPTGEFILYFRKFSGKVPILVGLIVYANWIRC